MDLNSIHQSRGASFVEDLGCLLPARFADPAAEQRFVLSAAGLLDRSFRGFLDLEGKDVAGFLDGLVSSSVTSLRPCQGEPSCLLTPKGRIIAVLHLHALEGGRFRMALCEPLRDAVVATVRKYAVLSDISVADRSGSIGVLSVQGAAAPHVLALVFPRAVLPASALSSSTARLEGVELTLVRGGETPEGGFDLWIPRGSLELAWKLLSRAVESVGGGPVGHEAAETLRVEAGVPRYGKDYGDENFPGEIGWERALTYDKCYVGQEIVSRMQTRGHANRRLMGLKFAGDCKLDAGDEVRIGGEVAGKVTSVARSERLGCTVALSLIDRRFWGAGEVAVDSRGGPGVLSDLPLVRFSSTAG